MANFDDVSHFRGINECLTTRSLSPLFVRLSEGLSKGLSGLDLHGMSLLVEGLPVDAGSPPAWRSMARKRFFKANSIQSPHPFSSAFPVLKLASEMVDDPEDDTAPGIEGRPLPSAILFECSRFNSLLLCSCLSSNPPRPPARGIFSEDSCELRPSL